MINENILQDFNNIDLEKDLIVHQNNLTYNYSDELWHQINDLYNLIKEAIRYITENTPIQFINNIQNAIHLITTILWEIKNTEQFLWSQFDSAKQNAINFIQRQLDEVFVFQDNAKLLITLNYLKNDFFAKNAKDITSDMFEEWANWKNEWLNKLMNTIEQKAQESVQKAEEIEKSSEVIEQVKTWKWFEEFEKYIEWLLEEYEKKKKDSFKYIWTLSVLLIIFIFWMKCWWFINFDRFYFDYHDVKYINFPYVIYQTLFWILFFSLLSYLLKLSVDEYKIYSNLLIELKNKSSIIKSYLLFMRYWDDIAYAETNKLIIDKTLEKLYTNWIWTHFWKEEKMDSKITEKILDIASKKL